MIPLLLWRCPLCVTNDALVHISRRLRADRVHCAHCSGEWRVRRVPGDNFYLKLVAGAAGVGDERSITEWYAAMKRTVYLEPISSSVLSLEPGEKLYLASGSVELEAEETDPLFFPGQENELPKAAKRDIRGLVVGRGRLFLTNRRIAWQDEKPGSPPVSFLLSQVNSAYAMMSFGVAFLIGMRLYSVYFAQESVLKWVTYIALVGRQVLAETGHRIATSHF